MNEFILDSNYIDCHPFDIYVDSTHLVTVVINNGQWEYRTSIIANMNFIAPCNGTFIIEKIKFTIAILPNLFYTDFLSQTRIAC